MLIVRNPNHMLIILWSCTGVIQGNPLVMVLYVIALVSLIKILQHAFLDVMKPWYADNLALMGKQAANAKCLPLLKRAGPWFGYNLEPEKLWHICCTEDEEEARATFVVEGLLVKFCWSN